MCRYRATFDRSILRYRVVELKTCGESFEFLSEKDVLELLRRETRGEGDADFEHLLLERSGLDRAQMVMQVEFLGKL